MRTERFRGALLSALVIASLITPLLLLSPSPVHAALTPHDPIYIDGNDNFTPANGVNGGGSGTENDQYIIENWVINASTAHGIHIRNTTAYFVIRNCVVENGWWAYPSYNGILLGNVVNGRVENNTCSNNWYGILLESSDNNTLDNNTCEDSYYAIKLDSSDNNTLSNNTYSNNRDGIGLRSSSNNTLDNNTGRNNLYYGVDLAPSSDNNLIYHNNFINNGIQAVDYGTNTWDDGYPSGGNYWSYYAGDDNYRGENQDIPGSDGIGDTPYGIPGGTNQDRYPLMNPWPSIRMVVNLTISPSYASGLRGGILSYTVAITNMGNVVDNYDLNASDNSGWVLNLSDNIFENVMSGGNRMATLSVTIPENAELGAEDLITVNATSQADNIVSDNDSCIAHVEAWTGTAIFRLVNLYTVNVEKILDLGQGSKLVVKFYKYDNVTFESENVIETFSPPWHVEENENARHPEGKAVKKVRLDLTYDDTENVIATIATFTVRRVNLIMRVSLIKSIWPFATPSEKSALIAEISGIKSQWPFAPW